MSDQEIVLTIDREGERLDVALADVLPEISRSQCQRLIKAGLVTIGGQPIKGSYRLSGEEMIEVIIPQAEPSDLLPEDIPLDVVFEDKEIIVIDKPAGMVVHPAAGNEKGTLVNAILHHFPDLPGIGGERRPGIVHRLDKETSGLIVIARSESALRNLQTQFETRSVKKGYQALVSGSFKQVEVIVEAPIGRDPRNRKRMAVIPDNLNVKSRPAETRFTLMENFGDYSLIRCQPLTGRTHQIRVHLSYLGYPIVGDPLYGRRKTQLYMKRMFLHAAQLSFRHPLENEEMTFHSDLPDELVDLLDKLRKTAI